jgi:hypothetical protein
MYNSVANDNGGYRLNGYYNGYPAYYNSMEDKHLYFASGSYFIADEAGSIYPSNARYQSGDFSNPVGTYLTGFMVMLEQTHLTSSSDSSPSSSSQSSSTERFESSSSYVELWMDRLYDDVVSVYREKTQRLEDFTEEYQEILRYAYRFTGWAYPFVDESSASHSSESSSMPLMLPADPELVQNISYLNQKVQRRLLNKWFKLNQKK